LASEQDKGKRMVAIFTERRELETKRQTAKGSDLTSIERAITKLDTEFEALNA